MRNPSAALATKLKHVVECGFRSYIEEQIARARKEIAFAQAVPKKKKADGQPPKKASGRCLLLLLL
jgi:hypothetical protein